MTDRRRTAKVRDGRKPCGVTEVDSQAVDHRGRGVVEERFRHARGPETFKVELDQGKDTR